MRLYMFPLAMTVIQAAALQPGDSLPELKGEFLTGKTAILPGVARGKVALLALGFSYDSRFPVEAWVKRFRADFGTNPEVTFYEIPMIGGLGAMGKWFIDSGMRKGTPKSDHEHVITVYGSKVGGWKDRLKPKSDKEACVILIDSTGIVRWSRNGMFDESAYKEMAAEASALLIKK
jgi:hypothetical protein